MASTTPPVVRDKPGKHSLLEVQVDAQLDARGMRCPMPLLKAKQAINRLAAGESLRVLATDPGSRRDFQVWASQGGFQLSFLQIDSESVNQNGNKESQYVYILKKPAP